MTKFLTILFFICCGKICFAQDPNFSQFYASPLTISPALTGNTDASWRGFLNYRQQWLGPSAPYNTATLSFDTKIMQERLDNSVIGIGVLGMMDNTFNGILKTSYGGLSLAYHQQVGGGGSGESYLGFGFGAVYGNKQLNFGELNFEEQFTNYGFNTSLPTGEAGLYTMKPFVSMNTGVLFSMIHDKFNFDMGASVFHLNKPKQTFLKDDLQVIPMRYVAHSSADFKLSDEVVINVAAMYQQQASINYWVLGGIVSKTLAMDENKALNVGLWYRNKDAVYPYVGMRLNEYSIGLSYDVTISKLNDAPKIPASWEISLAYKGINRNTGGHGSKTFASRMKCNFR